MTFDDAIRYLCAGHEVVNIGQLSSETTRWLRRAARAGVLTQFDAYHFPRRKIGWHAPDTGAFRSYMKRKAEAGRTPKE
jgi:hypothetical protein